MGEERSDWSIPMRSLGCPECGAGIVVGDRPQRPDCPFCQLSRQFLQKSRSKRADHWSRTGIRRGTRQPERWYYQVGNRSIPDYGHDGCDRRRSGSSWNSSTERGVVQWRLASAVGGLDIGAALEQEGCSMIIGAIPSYFAYERNRSRTPVTAASTSRSQTWPMVWTMGLICFWI